jgi:hypothetical protein
MTMLQIEWTENRGSIFPYRNWGPPSLLSNGHRGAVSLEVKRPKLEADHSPHAEVKISSSYVSTLMSQCNLNWNLHSYFSYRESKKPTCIWEVSIWVSARELAMLNLCVYSARLGECVDNSRADRFFLHSYRFIILNHSTISQLKNNLRNWVTLKQDTLTSLHETSGYHGGKQDYCLNYRIIVNAVQCDSTCKCLLPLYVRSERHQEHKLSWQTFSVVFISPFRQTMEL